jgi:hypothetical protein
VHAILGPDSPPFWPQFWPALIATVIGAFLGFWFALTADRGRDRRERGVEELGMLRTSRDAVNANLELAAQLHPILATPGKLPSFEMDVVLLDAVCPRLAQISSDTDLIGGLNNFRYQLHHVNRKLDRMLDLGLLPPSSAPGSASAVGAALVAMAGSISALTLAPLEKSGQDKLIPQLDARIEALEAPPSRWRAVLSRVHWA